MILPVYNDYESCNKLLKEITESSGDLFNVILIVNDGSDEEFNSVSELSLQEKNIQVVQINLIRNIGHQRAIAIGLCFIYENYDVEFVSVMDSDGEDKPEHLQELVGLFYKNDQQVIVATRSKRYESLWFKSFYNIYKILFRVMTGQKLNFGNFSILGQQHITRIVQFSEIWNNFPATLLKSNLPLRRVPLPRGKRLIGKSKMNLIKFIHHGIGAISVFSENVFIRILLTVTFIIVTFTLIIMILLGIRLFTDAALPGWTSILILFVLTFMIQIALLTILSLIAFVNRRSENIDGPLKYYKIHIKDIYYGDKK